MRSQIHSIETLHDWSGGEASGGQRALPFEIPMQFQNVTMHNPWGYKQRWH